MAILLKKIIGYRTSKAENSPIEITDDIRTNIKLSLGGSANEAEIILKNAYSEHVTDGEFDWATEDTIKIFLKYTDSTSAIIDIKSSDDLIVTLEIQEIEAMLEENASSWKLKCVDKSYTVLNRLWAKAYLTTDTHDVYGSAKVGWTPPEIIRDILLITTSNGDGTSGVTADLVSQGGYIQDTRPDSSSFESLRTELSISKVFKPVRDWIQDLSSTERTNTDSEITGLAVVKRPYIFYIDENNEAHWEYPGTTSADYEMTIGATGVVGSDTVHHIIHGHSLTKSVFDIVNMVIFNAGDDFVGNGILDYFYDPTTKSPTLKPVYKPMTEITKDWKQKEIIRGLDAGDYTLNNDTGTLIRDGRKYDASYSFTPIWSSSNVANDTALNTSLRTKAVEDAKTRARAITTRTANPRWKGKISVRGYKYQVGNLIKFNNSLHGIIDAEVRITDVQHTVNDKGWFTTLSVEEDPEEL